MKKYNKLIRDKVPEVMSSKGVKYSLHIANADEYLVKLREKLQEEVAEYLKDLNPDELADILEVIHALAQTHSLAISDIERIRIAKVAERGAFTKQLILDEAE